MPKKHPYLSKAQCTLFDFYTAKELEELVRSAPQLGFTARAASDGCMRFYARDELGRKKRLPKAIAEQSYIVERMHQADILNERGQHNSAGVIAYVRQRARARQRAEAGQRERNTPGAGVGEKAETAVYFQDRRDGKGYRQLSWQQALEASRAYRQFQACMKEGKFEEAVQLAREYLPADCSRVAEKVLAQRNGTSARNRTAGKEVVRQYEALLQQGTLESVEKAAALARKHLTRKEAEDAERKLYQIYNGVSLDEFAAWETGIEDYSAQSPLEEELRIEFGGNIGDYNLGRDGSAEDAQEASTGRNTSTAFGKGLAGVEV